MGFISYVLDYWGNKNNDQELKRAWNMWGSQNAKIFSQDPETQINKGYKQNIDVFAVIRKIIDVSNSVPWIVEQKLANGSWKELSDTPLHNLMDSPNVNKGYTWDDIDEMLTVFLLATGNAYLHGEKPFASNAIAELDVLPSQNIYVQDYNGSFFMPEYKFRFNFQNTQKVFSKEDVCHIRMFNPTATHSINHIEGLSPIQVAATVVQSGNDRQDASANLRQNRGVFGIVTDKGTYPMTPEEADMAQKAFDKKTTGTDKYGKVMWTNKDLNYIQMAMSPSDLQLIEGGVVDLRAICNVFGLDSSLFNDPENKTYSNRTEAEKSMFTNCIIPLSKKKSADLTRYLCPNLFPGKTVRLRQDFKHIEVLQENFKEKSDSYKGLKLAGIYTANEVRLKLGDEKSNDPSADILEVNNNQPVQAPATN